MLLLLLADTLKEVSKEEIKGGYGGLIFMGLFALACMGAAIWWLRR